MFVDRIDWLNNLLSDSDSSYRPWHRCNRINVLGWTGPLACLPRSRILSSPNLVFQIKRLIDEGEFINHSNIRIKKAFINQSYFKKLANIRYSTQYLTNIRLSIRLSIRLNILLDIRLESTMIHQIYYSALTRLRSRTFSIHLDDEFRVGTPLRRNLLSSETIRQK